ncbi:MAG: hypothetical protein D6B27_07625 [Gammaproteobacteria bacterium]|nr:MAG: hypothetical protein D6B27_07625 [Gammaproteobacteria bacterium]
MRSLEYKKSAKELLQYLNFKLDAIEGFPDQPTWGYAFTLLAALQYEADLNKNELAQKALALYEKQSKPQKIFSWEFTTFAINLSATLTKEQRILDLCAYKAKGTRMINWALLRQLNKVYTGKDSIVTGFILRIIKLLFTTSDGQILDEFYTRSLQYHAFCLFVLTELDKTGRYPWVSDWLIRGCRFSNKMILNDGTALYIGRGQEQIFGYGALIYALEYVDKHYKQKFESSIEKVWHHVSSFQREDGSYPLVLRSYQAEHGDISYDSDKPHGWYSYNTLYDYQPFLAYCLLMAANESEK